VPVVVAAVAAGDRAYLVELADRQRQCTSTLRSPTAGAVETTSIASLYVLLK
jgi:hypothetical protein